MDRLSQLQEMLRTLQDFGDEVKASPGLTTEETVALGQRLWDIRECVDGIFNPLKDSLRAKGLQETKGLPGTRHFFSPDGSRCTVTVPVSVVQVKKDADTEGLKVLLGPDFAELFEEVITYKTRKDFQKKVPDLEPDKTKAALDAVKVVESTTRVMFGE